MGEGDRSPLQGPPTLTLPRTRGREGLTVRGRHTDAMAASAHFLPGLDWLIKLGIGLIVAAAGVLLIRPRRRDGWRFAIGIFTIEVGALVAIRGIVAAGGSSWWQYLMPFALVLVPGIFIAVVLTRLRWWRRVGFTPLWEWQAPHLVVPLVLILVLPIVGFSARGMMATTALVLTLQVGFVLIDIFMEEVTYRGVILEALAGLGGGSRVAISATLFGLSHLDNFFLPGADELGVAYQIFEAALVGVLFGAVRLRMNAIWPGDDRPRHLRLDPRAGVRARLPGGTDGARLPSGHRGQPGPRRRRAFPAERTAGYRQGPARGSLT